MKAISIIAFAACTPAKHPSWAPKNNTAPTAAHRGEHPLHFGEHCSDGEVVHAGRDEITIVTCFVPNEEDGQETTAYFVRRSAPDRGTSQPLGTWTQYRESGESWQIDGATHDRVVLSHHTGGLDQVGDTELRIYDSARDAFTGQVVRGPEIKVVVAPGGASATAFVCELAHGGTYELGKACGEQVGAKTKPIAID